MSNGITKMSNELAVQVENYRSRKKSATSPVAISPGQSLQALVEAAANPPRQIKRLQILESKTMVFYIFRVPGRKDLCLSFYRPAGEVVTEVDVMSAVYYCRYDGDTYTLLRRDPTMNNNFKDVALIMDPPGHIDVYESAYSKIEERYWSLNEQDRFSSHSNFGCYVQQRHGGLEFLSPWAGTCELVPAKMGASLKALTTNKTTTAKRNAEAARRHAEAIAIPLLKSSSTAVANHFHMMAEDAKKGNQYFHHKFGSTSSTPEISAPVNIETGERKSTDLPIRPPSMLDMSAVARHSDPIVPQYVSPGSALRAYSKGGPGGEYTILESPSVFTKEPLLPDHTHNFALHSHPPPEYSVVGPPSRSSTTSMILESPGSDDIFDMYSTEDLLDRDQLSASPEQSDSPFTKSTQDDKSTDAHQIRRKPVATSKSMDSNRTSRYVDSNRTSRYVDSNRTSRYVDSKRMSTFGDSKRMSTFGDSKRMSTFGDSKRMSSFGDNKRTSRFDDKTNRVARSNRESVVDPSWSNVDVTRQNGTGNGNSSKENSPPASSRRPCPPPTRRSTSSNANRPMSMFIPDNQADRVLVDEHRKSLREMKELREREKSRQSMAGGETQEETPRTRARSNDNARTRTKNNNRNSAVVSSSASDMMIRAPDLSPLPPARDDRYDDRHIRSQSESPSLHPIPDLYPDNGSPSPPGHADLNSNLPHPTLSVPGVGAGTNPLATPAPNSIPPSSPITTDVNGNKILDLTLAREKLGGGFDGEQAKLGKLIVEAEGLRMLDLIVATNMLAFTRAARVAGVWM